VGAPGTVAGVAELEAPEAEDVPNCVVVLHVNVYDCPLVRPVTIKGLLVPDFETPEGLETH